MRRNKREYEIHKEKARQLVNERLPYWNTFYNFTYNRIAIKNSKTRWGSCSAKGNLNFNYRLALLPPRLADYIIVHELCHLGEFNHGTRFWELVAKTFPDYEELRVQLKQRSVLHYLQLSTLRSSIKMKLKKALGVLIILIALAPLTSSAKTNLFVEGMTGLMNAKSYTYVGTVHATVNRGKNPTASTDVSIAGKSDLSDLKNPKQDVVVTLTDSNPAKPPRISSATVEITYSSQALFLQLMNISASDAATKAAYSAYLNTWIKLTPESSTTINQAGLYGGSTMSLTASTSARIANLYLSSNIITLGKKVGTKVIGGHLSTGYAFTINKTNLVNAETIAAYIISGTALSQSEINNERKAWAKINYSNATLWFGNDDTLPHRVTFTLKSSEPAKKLAAAYKSSMVFDFTIQDYNVPQGIVQPAAYKTLEEVLKSVFGAKPAAASSTLPQYPQSSL